MFEDILKGLFEGAAKPLGRRNGILLVPCLTGKQGHAGCDGVAYVPEMFVALPHWRVCSGCYQSKAR